MPFSFPASPSTGDKSTQNGREYEWSGYAWEIVATPASLNASVITAGTLDAARLPLATTIAAGAVIVGTGLGVSSGTVSVTYGTSAGTACQGNDARLSDTRTPTDGSVTTAKIANDAVTYAKLQNVSATDRLLGRSSAGSGDVEEITCTAFGRSLIGSADAAAARTTLSVQPTASPAFTGGPSIINSGASDNSTIRYGNASADWYVGLRGDTSNVFAITDASSFRLTISTTGVSTFSGSVVINNDGNVVPLTVTNTGTANSFVVNDASGDTTPFVIDADGRVIIGGTAVSALADTVSVIGTLRSANNNTTAYAARCTLPSDNTGACNLFLTVPGTQAASFTLPALRHFVAVQGTFGAGSTVTDQYGFIAFSNLTGATNNYGFYSDIASGSGRWNFYANGTAASFFGGQVQISTGSASAPGVAFSGDPDTGIAQLSAAGANTLSICTNSAERVRVGSGGNVAIGAIDPQTALHIDKNADGALVILRGAQTANTQHILFRNPFHTNNGSAGTAFVGAQDTGASGGTLIFATTTNGSGASGTPTERMSIANDGVVKMNDVYGDTVGATNRDLFIDDTGKLGYVSSIRASKTNIAAIDDVSWLRDLTPVSFHYRKRNEDGTYSNEPDGTLDYGLIAEEVEPVAPEMCFYDVVDGEPQLRGVHYSKLITPMLRYIQQLEQRIAALEERNHA